MQIETKTIQGVMTTVIIVAKNVNAVGIKCFDCEGWGHRPQRCLSTPLNKSLGQVVDTYNLPPEMHNQVEGNQGH